MLGNVWLERINRAFQGVHLSPEIISGINREGKRRKNNNKPAPKAVVPTDDRQQHVVQEQGDEDDEEDEFPGLPALPEPAEEAELAPSHAPRLPAAERHKGH